jgi:hypothetical protein
VNLLRSTPVAILLFTLLCTAATWFALGALGLRFAWPHAAIATWFCAVSLLLHLWQERGLAGDIKRFMRRFLAGLVLKLLVSLVLAAVLMFLVKDDRKALMIVFVLWYLAFLGFSTARLVMLLRAQAPGNTQRP